MLITSIRRSHPWGIRCRHTSTVMNTPTTPMTNRIRRMRNTFAYTEKPEKTTDGNSKRDSQKKSITEKMAMRQTPQPVVVRAEFARAQGQPNTKAVEEGWSEKKIRADHPYQAKEFGIGNMLTAGTSNSDDGKYQDSNRGSKTTESTAAEPWTLVTGKKKGRQHKLGKEREEKTNTDRPDHDSPTRVNDNDIKATTPRPTYNQVQLGIMGEKEAQSTALQAPKK